DALGDARAPLVVRHPAQLELPGVLAAHADAEDQPAARQRVERRRGLGRDGGGAERQQVDRGAEPDAAGDGHVRRQQRERLVDRSVEGYVVTGPHGLEAERLDAADEVELRGRRLERQRGAEPRRQRGKASLTPPSTVSVQPVVLAERSEARNSTAWATSS